MYQILDHVSTVNGIYEADYGSIISINGTSVTADINIRPPASTQIFGGTNLNNNNLNLCNQIGARVDTNTVVGIGNIATFTTDCAP